jgi:MFS family permease
MLDVGGLPRAFWWLWTGTLVNRTGAFVLPFMAYYLTESLGHSAAFAGFVASVNAIGAAISAVVGGVLADRVGRRPTLLGAQVGSAATLVALGLVHTAPLIAVLSFLVGLANNASRPATSALIADLVRPEDRTRAYALNFWAINLGFAIAMLAAGVLASHSYLLLFVGDATTTVACAALIFWKVPETHRPERRRARGADGADPAADESSGATGSLLDVLRDRVYLGFLGAMLIGGVIYMQANATQPISMGRDGLGPSAYGVVGALNGIVIVVLQMPLTSWFRRFSYGRVLAGSTLLVGGGFAIPLVIAAVGHPMGVYVASVAVWTIGEIGMTPTEMAMAADLAPAHLRGRYQGMYTLTWSLCGIIGPLLGGWALSVSGSAAVWWGSLALGAVSVPVWLVIGRWAAPRVAAARSAEGAPASAEDAVSDAVPNAVPVTAGAGSGLEPAGCPPTPAAVSG